MDGLILVRKPPFWTSHDVVAFLRRTLGEKRVGHFGTLDPLATGLLLGAIGRATRLFPYFGAYPKSYEARIRLGIATDTYDAEGSPTAPECVDLPDPERLAAALRQFEGEIDQLPPPYSAKKHLGKPLYAYARKNQEVERRPSRVRLHSVRLRSYAPPIAEVEIVCSSGTYIRSLAHDLGRNLGCGAHLDGLVRTAIGPFELPGARDPEEIRSLQEAGRTSEFLIPLENLLTELPAYVLADEEEAAVLNGRSILRTAPAPSSPGGDVVPVVRLIGPEGRLLALAKPGGPDGRWAPAVVFP
jgi:tRNA pseudouridine55 synthase